MGTGLASLNRQLRWHLLVLGLVGATLIVVACELTGPSDSIITIDIAGDSTLIVGTPIVPRFTVTVDGLPVAAARLRMESSNPGVISIVGDTLLPLRRGTADITVVLVSSTLGDEPPTATLSLRAIAATVDIAETGVLLESIGDTVRLTPVVLSSTANALTVDGAEWFTGDAEVAAVNAVGRVEAVNAGTVDVSLVIDGDTASVSVQVRQRVTRYELSPDPLTIQSLGAIVTLTATPLDAGGSEIPAGSAPAPTWATRDQTIASVSNAGAVTALDNGVTFIVASAPDVADSVQLTVRQVATKVEILPSRTVLGAIEDTVRLSAVASDALGEDVVNQFASWVSSDIRVAQVGPTTGVVRALDEGTVVIVAKLDTAADSVTLTIADSAASVALPADTFRFSSLNDTTQLSVTVRNKFHALLADQSVTWSIGDSTVAGVGSDGRLAANGIGTTILVVRAADPAKVEAVDTATVIVNNLPETVNIVPVDTVLTSVGDQYSPPINVRNARGGLLDRSSVSWSTKDSTVATVNSSGLIVARGRGSTFVLAVNPLNVARRDSVEITVSNAPETVDLTPDNVVLTAPGRTKQYQVLVRNRRGDVIVGDPVRYITRNPGIVTIDDVGLATGQAEGVTWILAEAGGGGALFPLVRDSVMITVENNVVQVTLNPTAAILPSVGDTRALDARALNDFGATVENVPFAWSSTDTSIAAISAGGIVTANGVGTAIITVQYSGLSATSEIEVRNSPATIVIDEDTLDFASVLDQQAPTVTLLNSLGAPLGNSAARWESNNPLVAQVDDFGNITARARGVTSVRASNPLNSGIADVVLVRVLNTPVDIIIDPRTGQTAATRTDTLASLGRTLDYGARVFNLRGNVINDVSVVWETEFNTVATISSTAPTTARATAVSPGTTGVTATVDETPLIDPLPSPLTDDAVLVVRNNAASLSISPNSVSLTSVGFSTDLTLTVLNEAGNPIDSPDVVWSVVDPSVAQVTENGSDARLATVLARTVGSTSAVADVLDEGGEVVKSTSVPVTVTDYPNSISIEAPAETTFASVGDILQLVRYDPTDPQPNHVEIRNGNGSLLALSAAAWSTNDANVAQVSQAGFITARGTGTTTITAANPVNPSIAADFAVTVTNATASLTIQRDGLDITGDSFVLSPIPRTADLKATPRNAANGETTTQIAWSAASPGIVTITPNPDSRFAQIRANGTGTTIVTATAQDNGLQAQVTVTVTNPASTITLTPSSGQILEPGPAGTLQLTATATNTLGTVLPDSDLVLTSNRLTIADVSNDAATFGMVTATTDRNLILAPQNVIITARDEGNNVSKTSTITVVVGPADIRFTESDRTTDITTLALTSIGAKARPDSGYTIVVEDTEGNELETTTVEWTVVPDDGTIVVDNTSGRITAAAEGTVTLRATSLYDPNLSDDIQVTVEDIPTTVTVTPATFTFTAVDATRDFNAAVKNAMGGEVSGGTLTWTVGPDATNQWPTQADSVLDIDANTGLVTALKVGTGMVRATIVKDGVTVTGTANLTVTNVPASLSISPETVTITSVGGSTEILAVVLNSEGTRINEPTVTWELVSGPLDTAFASSTNDTVTVTATATGTATVRATAGTASNQRTITVTNEIDSIGFTTTNPAAMTLDGIGTQVLKEDSVDVFNAIGGAIPATAAAWSVTPTGIVTVAGDSIIAVGVGSATVTARNPNNAAISANLAVTVTNAPANVALSDTGDTFARLGQQLQYSATVTNSQGVEISPATVNWTIAACSAPPAGVSPNAAALTVSPASGKFVTVTAAGAGCATVTATSGSVAAAEDFVAAVARRLYVNQVIGAARDTGSIDLEHGTLKYPFKALANAIAFGTANSGDTVVIQRTPASYVQSVIASVGNLTISGDTTGCGLGCTASQLPTLTHGAQAPIIRSDGVRITFEDLIIVANADTAALEVDATGGDNVQVNRVVISDPNGASDGSGLRIDGAAGSVTVASLLVRDLGAGITMTGSATNIAITNGRYLRNGIGIRLPTTITGTLNVSGNDLFDNDDAGLTGSPTSGAPFDNWWGDNLGPRAETGFDTTAVGDSIAFSGSFSGTVAGFDAAPNRSASGSATSNLIAKLNANSVVSNRVLVSRNPERAWVATLAVRAVDAQGLPTSNTTVTPDIVVGGQNNDRVTCVNCTTGSDGIARLEVELDARQGGTDLTDILRTVRISVTSGGSGTVDINVAFPAAGVPAQYILTTPVSTPDAGVAFVVTATLADAAGNLVNETGRTLTWASTNGGDFGSPTSPVTNGVATVQFTPSQTPNVTHTLSATDDANLFGELAVTTVVGSASATQTTITAADALIAADGESTTTITVQLKDQYGNNLVQSDGTVVLTLNSAVGGTISGLADQTNGTWTATLTASQDAGTVQVEGTLDTGGGAAAIGTSASVNFVQQVANADNSTVVANPTVIGTSAESAITVTARDAADRVIKNASVTVTSSGSGNTISGTTTTDENGEATFIFSSTVEETKSISAEIVAGGSTTNLTDASTITVDNNP